MQLAEVIVDVPSMQTDQPFTYMIPTEWENSLEVGMRVEVPFGNGNRHIQGFIVRIREENEIVSLNDGAKMKEIVKSLDVVPVLTHELLQLADYMKERTYAFKITCLQTMLPSVMKAKYEKQITVLDFDQIETDIRPFFGQKKEILYDEAVEVIGLSKLKALRQTGAIELNYLVKNNNNVRTIKMIQSLVVRENYEQFAKTIRKGAMRKVQLLERLTQHTYRPLKDYVAEGISSSVINQAEKDGWLQVVLEEVYRDPFAHRSFEKTQAFKLNEEQQIALEAIMNENAHQTFLLEGITGSGKTEVYLQAISNVLEKGKTAMMLVPEIALTPQMVERFKGRFGDLVAVLHSGLSQGERYDEWRKIERGEAKVVVGARSAVFAPLENIGLIVVDEEHEASYKQEETPRYHARDLAIWRGKFHECPVVLGSATPSLESRARAQKKVYRFLQLTRRGNPEAILPSVEIIDMKQEVMRKETSTFSQILQDKMRDRLEKEEQIVLLLNRRGYSSFVMCRDCGYVLPCPNCDISLTLHMDTRTMRCHYCGHEEQIPHHCSECQSNKIRYYGTGTQKVEEELRELFPTTKILRMDVDTTRKKGAHERILREFGDKKASILLGTQMIAKGLDFPDITLVGILNADTSLNLPDFRSGERTFQLITQVSGRAGRAKKKGEVVIQTFNPEHHAIVLAQLQDYEKFYQREMHLRHQSGYPPYYYTVKIVASHENEEMAAKKMFQVYRQLEAVLSKQAQILGPTPNAIMRVKNRYYYQIIVKYKQEPLLTGMLDQLLLESQKEQRMGLFLSIDNEPLSFI